MTMQGVPTLNPVAGFSNAPLDSFGAKFPSPNWPGSFYTFQNDFDFYTAGLAASTAKEEWLAAPGAVAGVAAVAVSDALGGVLSVVTTTTVDDAGYIAQYRGGNGAGTAGDIAETFTFTPGKESFFATRFSLSDVLATDFMVGLMLGGATIAAVSDGVFFRKTNGSNVLQLVSSIIAPGAVSAQLRPMVNATFVEAAFHYNGIDRVNAYMDGQYAGGVGVANLPTRTLAVSFGVQNGDAIGTRTLLLDWIVAARER